MTHFATSGRVLQSFKTGLAIFCGIKLVGIESIQAHSYDKARIFRTLWTFKVFTKLSLANYNGSRLKDAGEVLASKFGYRRSREAVRRLLHRWGHKRRKTGTFLGKIDDFEAWQAKPEAFIEKLEALIE